MRNDEVSLYEASLGFVCRRSDLSFVGYWLHAAADQQCLLAWLPPTQSGLIAGATCTAASLSPSHPRETQVTQRAASQIFQEMPRRSLMLP
jgi:hypothetical protein